MAYTDMQVAEMLREIMRLLQKFNGQEVVSAWADRSPQEQQASAERAGKMRAGGVTPELAHELWREQRASEGWTYGPVKDYELKTSPSMVPYAQLLWEERVKDKMYEAVVAIMSEAG